MRLDCEEVLWGGAGGEVEEKPGCAAALDASAMEGAASLWGPMSVGDMLMVELGHRED